MLVTSGSSLCSWSAIAKQQMALWHFNTTLLLTGLTINDALVQFRLVCCLFALVA